MANHTELAWAAGFIDGEGCFSILKGVKYSYFRLTVAQVDRRPLDRLAKIFELGNVKGPYQRSGVRIIQYRAPIFNWTLTGTSAKKIYNLVQPYLSEPKQEQAQRCFIILEIKEGQLKDQGRLH
jgi:LAGLIDADG endonuclease